MNVKTHLNYKRQYLSYLGLMMIAGTVLIKICDLNYHYLALRMSFGLDIV